MEILEGEGEKEYFSISKIIYNGIILCKGNKVVIGEK